MDFQNEHLANVARQQSQKAKIQDRVLIVDVIGGSEISRTKDDANKTNGKLQRGVWYLLASSLPMANLKA